MHYSTDQGHGLPFDPFKALVAPRPIAWISTVSDAGNRNLAPFSFFNAVSSEPPMVAVAINGTQESCGGAKDTLANLRENGEMVVNLATWRMRDAVSLTSAPLPPGEDEIAAAGLTPVASRMVRPPAIAESPAHLECRLFRLVELPANTPGGLNTLAICHVVLVHVDDSVIRDGIVDTVGMDLIARLGYADYVRVERTFTVARPAPRARD